MIVLAEIITIGDEILLGQITDTNSQYISARLTAFGIDTVRKTSVGDSADDIRAAIDAAFARAHVLVLTGGLGPTKDDITKKILARYFQSGMRRDAATLAFLQEYFARRGRELSELNQGQADVPEVCTVIPNEKGTAPGMWFDKEGKVLVSMPGVPHEMKHMLDAHILPKLKTVFPLPNIIHRFVQTAAIPEADLSQKVAHVEDALPAHLRLAYLPSRGGVTLRLTGRGEDETSLIDEIDSWHEKLMDAAGPNAFSGKDENLSRFIVRRFFEVGKTFASAESCTGGEFAARVTKQPGSGDSFLGTAVTYATPSKVQLGVPQKVIDQYGVVSEETAKAMAVAAKEFFKSDYAVSSTGVAGPTSPYPGIPVGRVVLGVAGPKRTIAKTFSLTLDRDFNIEIATTYMTNLLRLEMENDLVELKAKS